MFSLKKWPCQYFADYQKIFLNVAWFVDTFLCNIFLFFTKHSSTLLGCKFKVQTEIMLREVENICAFFVFFSI